MHNQQEMIFKPNQWLKVLEQMQDLLPDNNQALECYAAPGCGKTTFITVLKQEIPEHYKIYDIKASNTLKIKTLLNDISAEFATDFKDLGSVIKWLNENRRHLILIIDDADKLPEDILKKIYINFSSAIDSNKFFHLILCSTKALLLDGMASFNLGTLTEIEAKTYIQFCARKQQFILTNKELNEIFASTGGVIALINNALINFTSKKSKNNQKSILFKLLMIATLTMISFVAGYGRFIWQQELATNVPNSINTPSLLALAPYYLKLVKNSIKPITPEVVIYTKPNKAAPKKIIKKITSPVPDIKSHVSESKGYTIQLIASRELTDIKQFIIANHLKNKAQIKILVKNGLTWYVAVIGGFKNKAEANSAMQNLDDDIKLHKPWPRSLKDLQAFS